ncbi:MAG: hypothetical protein HQL32_09235 [Planctomycetes bacterium]|nr:hypothetical protein [Planctomycetota bacterium]
MIIGALLILSSFTQKVISNSAELGQQTKCLISLKIVGDAFELYWTDHNGDLPHEDFGSTKPPYEMCWYHLLDPYISVNPKYTAKQDPSYLELHNNDSTQAGFSYKMNSRLEDYQGSKSSPSPSIRNINTVLRPRPTVLLFDGRVDKNPYIRRSYGMHTSVENRHDGKSSMLFLDNHVELISGPENELFWTNEGDYTWDPDK